MTATQDDVIAELQRANAELLRQRDAALSEKAALAEALAARDTALAQRNTQYSERIEHQAATVDVLKVMSASPGEAQPVFDLIVRQAKELCNCMGGALYEYDGELVHLRTNYGGDTDAATVAKYIAMFPMAPTRASFACRAIVDREVVHIRDTDAEPEQFAVMRDLERKAQISVPLLRNGVAIGAIALGAEKAGGFSDSQVALLQTFAEQAVIAITSAETYRALQTRTADLQESLEYQTATSDVLKVISRSTFDLQPVLKTVVETAARLCDADQATINRREGDGLRLDANFGFPLEYETRLREIGVFPMAADSTSVTFRAIKERRVVHIHDVASVPGYPEAATVQGRQRTSLGVPLLREGQPIGVILLARQRVEPFTDRQIELVSTFADQAVIAIENTRLITEQREALEQQTATAEVLGVINRSPGDLVPVFDAMLEKAMRLCGGTMGGIFTFDGDHSVTMAVRGVTAAFAEYNDKYPMDKIQPGSVPACIIETRAPVQYPDVMAGDLYLAGHPYARALVELGSIRAVLAVPLLKDGVAVGMIAIYRQKPDAFPNKQIALLENFAAQAVIAMENARLLDQIRQRQEELRVTFENMGDGVAMFDETQHLVAWNSKFQEIFDLPDTLLEQQRTYEEHLHFLGGRGDFGAGVDTAAQIHELVASTGQPYGYERTRPDGRVIEIRRNPVPDGGFVLIFSDITERKRSEAEIRAARDAAEEASRTIEAAYRELKTAQANLIQAEKMASLGQLTAGIAHEIKNPLNFVNNFAALSVDLLSELKETAAPGFAVLTDDQRAEIDDVSAMLTSNLEKITEHGKRADGIVKAMLEHSRGSSAERRMVDLNALIDEALNLAYHGARAQDQSFNITLERDFGQGIAQIEVNPQDMTRVFLNLFSNGFYAATKRARNGEDARFEPTLKVTTRNTGDAVEIRVRDNGTGIQADIRDKLFQPFFTTKPTGEGTGLGLSITYDIVTKQHGGSIAVDSKVGDYSEFTIRLPRNL